MVGRKEPDCGGHRGCAASCKCLPGDPYKRRQRRIFGLLHSFQTLHHFLYEPGALTIVQLLCHLTVITYSYIVWLRLFISDLHTPIHPHFNNTSSIQIQYSLSNPPPPPPKQCHHPNPTPHPQNPPSQAQTHPPHPASTPKLPAQLLRLLLQRVLHAHPATVNHPLCIMAVDRFSILIPRRRRLMGGIIREKGPRDGG